MEAEGMEAEGTMEANLAAEFWVAVEDCLVRFHRFEPGAAKQETHALWERLRQAAQPAGYRDMVYHEEPWYIACDLAGREDHALRRADWRAYEDILKMHGLAPGGGAESMSAGNG